MRGARHLLSLPLPALLVAGCAAAATPASAPPSTPTPSTPTASHASAPARTTAPAPAGMPPVPPVSTRARAAGLLDVRSIVPDAVLDLRYATSHNFTGTRLYPTDARCLVHRSMAAGLRAAAHRLRRDGYLLVFWDCYRPHAVQLRMFRIVPDPNWVARPGPYATSHEAGRSVDVTLARARTGGPCATQLVRGHCLLAMGTGFDAFTPRAHAYATDGVSAAAQANRDRLRHAMNAGGLEIYAGEWWHVDGPGSGVHRPVLHAPLR